MSFLELFILAVGLSMDAFAVAICAGLAMAKANLKKALIVGLYFGIFQAGMPLIGYLIASLFAERIFTYGDWVAFAVLSFLGGKIIFDSFKRGDDKQTDQEQSLSFATMLPLAFATSIDALAVGASFAFIQVSIIPAVAFIGITTFVISMAGVKIGNIFGIRFKSKAQVAGGVILVLIGLKILLEHLGVIIL